MVEQYLWEVCLLCTSLLILEYSFPHIFAQYAIGNRIKLLLDSALQAGKNARDPYHLSELEPLRGFGGSANYPEELSRKASEVRLCLFKRRTDFAIQF